MLSEQLLETIRHIVAPLDAEERLVVIQTIAAVAMTGPAEEPGKRAAPDPDEMSLEAEQVAWFARPAEDREQYTGEYVAVRHGEVIDHDPDRRALYLRMRERFDQQ